MRLTIFVFAALLLASVSYGQKDIGILKLDSTFGVNGIAETSFPGSGILTASDIPAGNISNRKVLIAGKVDLSGRSGFGMFQCDANGTPDPLFGIQGKSIAYFDSIAYPRFIRNYYLGPYFDSVILGAGVSFSTNLPTTPIPSIFRFKAGGAPDSTFGIGGRTTIAFENNALGEFCNFDRIQKGQPGYGVASGYIINNPSPAFAAAWVSTSGQLDSGYGNNGIQLVSAPIQWATGFYTQDRRMIFVGISTAAKPEIILSRLTSSGKIDSTFGTNGVLNSGIILKQGTTSLPAAYFPLDNAGRVYVLASLDSQPDLPLTIIRFSVADGLPDQAYGQNGFATASIISSMSGLGLSISPDKSVLISGRAQTGQGQCAVAKFGLDGFIDTTFGNKGVAIVDVGNGVMENYLTNLNTIGKQLFIGAGMIGNPPTQTMLLTRFAPINPKNDVVIHNDTKDIRMFPNPCSEFLQIHSEDAIISIAFTDMHGAILRTIPLNSSELAHDLTIDISTLPNGAYFALIKSKSGIFSEKFAVMHP